MKFLHNSIYCSSFWVRMKNKLAFNPHSNIHVKILASFGGTLFKANYVLKQKKYVLLYQINDL